MKYLTKEWYWWHEAQRFERLKIEPRAAHFSDELYQELYIEEEQKWLNEWYEREEKTKKWLKERNVNVDIENYPSEVMFKPLSEKKQVFAKVKEYEMKITIAALGCELRGIVPDLRVLALGFASQETADRLCEYAQECKKNIEQREREALDDRHWLFVEYEPAWMQRFDFHDYLVESAFIDGNDFIIHIDEKRGYDWPKQVIFHNASLVEYDAPLDGASWLCDEVYPVECGFEIHALLVRNWQEPLCVTLICDDVRYIERDELRYDAI